MSEPTSATPITIPALRCLMGQWVYYATVLPFSEIATRVSPVADIHKSKRLRDWIQREIESTHADNIARYLDPSNRERFFSSVVVGVYDGAPEWVPLSVEEDGTYTAITRNHPPAVNLERSIGALVLSGSEKLFAIDGQHRVAGIRKAIQLDAAAAKDELTVLFVAHSQKPDGMKRTRRLFTTLNKTAKKVTASEIVALDEDDPFAVVTRQLVDDDPLFTSSPLIAMKGGSALGKRQADAISSIVGLYEISRDLAPYLFDGRTPKQVLLRRPDDKSIAVAQGRFSEFWRELFSQVSELQRVLKDRSIKPAAFRTPERSHLLFRPVGQRAFAGAAAVLIQRNISLRAAIKSLTKAPLWIHEAQWHHLMWDPIRDAVISKNRILCESMLLRLAGHETRTKEHARKLAAFLKEREK